MTTPDVIWKGGRFGQTSRRDPWWLSPSAVFLGFGAFLVYATWAAFQNGHYTYGPYISPFYSPEIFGNSPHALFGPKPALVSKLSAVLAGAAHSVDTRPLPAYLLLLPRRLLQIILGRSSGLCRGRAAQDLSGRAKLSADSAEFPSLLSAALLPRLGLPGLRRRDSRSGFPTASESASEASFWWSMSCCWPDMSSAATRSGTWSEAVSTRSRNIPCGTSSTIA